MAPGKRSNTEETPGPEPTPAVPMKFALATTAVLFALPLFAQDAEPLDIEPVVDPVAVSTSLVQLDVASGSEKSVDNTLTTLEDLIEDLPSNPELRTRLLSHIADLRSSTLEVFVIEQELAALRREFVSARLFRALDALSDRAIAGDWSRDMAQAVAAEFFQRAGTFVDAPDPVDFRNRVMAALERSVMMASSTSQMLAILRMEILMDRLSLLESELQAMLTNGEISVEQYQESYQRQVIRARMLYIEWTNV